MASFIFKFLVFNELYDRVTLMIIMFVPKVSKISCKHQPTKEAFDITAGCLSTRANSPMTGAPITTRVPRQKVAAGMGQDLSTSLLRQYVSHLTGTVANPEAVLNDESCKR